MAARAIAKKIINTPKAPKPVGPYNQAIVAGDMVYVAGMIGLDPETGKMVTGGINEQTDRTLQSIGEVLKAAGSSFENVVKTTVLMADLKDYADMNTIYAKYFTDNYPARAAYQVAALPLGALIEIETIAIVGDQ